jgi:hypothetical protein
LATLIWLFSIEPESFTDLKSLWGQLEDRLESLANEEVEFQDRKTVISTIRIAKSLVQF